MKSKIWTKEEILIIDSFYVKYGNRYCASKLEGRSIASIRKKAKKMGLTTKVKIYNLNFIESNLSKLCLRCKSVGEILDLIGLRRVGGNYKVVKSYINKYGIDTSHFVTLEEMGRILNFNSKKASLSDVLIENSDYNRGHLKKRLYKEGILAPICSLCGQDENWKGVKISLILDHINGVHNDNRIENLRIVCPNCNAGLDTFAGKNNDRKKIEIIRPKKIVNSPNDVSKKKKVKIRVDMCICGGEKNINSKLCMSCHRLNRRVVERPPIDELIFDIESMGYSATGRKYGVSDNAIRKWIKNN